MLAQLSIAMPVNSEIAYLAKIRDRFLSHVQLAGVRRGSRPGLSIPETGRIHRDVVGLDSWYSDDLRALGHDPANIKPAERELIRAANESLILTKKQNERFTAGEVAQLMFAGVRECDLEQVGSELAVLLDNELRPVLIAHSEKAIQEFGMERIP